MARARLCVALVLALAGAAGADEAAPSGTEAVGVATSEESRGEALYRAAKYADAERAFEAAYQASPRPDVLVWIGRCHLALARFDAAVFFFRGYLEYAPEAAPRRAEVERLIAEAEAEKAARSAEAAAARAGEGRRPIYRRFWFWTALGAVVVGGAAAAVLPLALERHPLPTDQLGTIDAR